MGEAATNKIGRDDREELDRLRHQIEIKRQQISSELTVLRRRRAEAMMSAKRMGVAVGTTAVGILVVGSLVNAVADIFRTEDEQPKQAQLKLTDALAALAVMTLRTVAMQFVQSRVTMIRERLAEKQDETEYIEAA